MALKLTNYEISMEIRNKKRIADASTHYISGFQKRVQSSQRSLELYNIKSLEHPDDDSKGQRIRRRIRYYTHNITAFQRRIQEEEQHRATAMREIEEFELMKETYLSPISSQPSEPITLVVRLLSGDLLTVSVDRAHQVTGFADHFVKQHNYNDIATSRLVFLIMPEEQEQEQEEEKQLIFWSPEERHIGKSIGDVLGSTLPILNLVIRPTVDVDQMQKATTLRKILHSLKRDDSMSDDALFELYSNWRLTANISVVANRYQKMIAFIEANQETFPILEESSLEEQARRADLLAFRSFRSRMRPWRPQRAESARDWLQQLFRRYGENLLFRPDQILFFLRILTIDQFFQEGVTIRHIPTTWKYYRFLAEWERYNREADAM